MHILYRIYRQVSFYLSVNKWEAKIDDHLLTGLRTLLILHSSEIRKILYCLKTCIGYCMISILAFEARFRPWQIGVEATFE